MGTFLRYLLLAMPLYVCVAEEDDASAMMQLKVDKPKALPTERRDAQGRPCYDFAGSYLSNVGGGVTVTQTACRLAMLHPGRPIMYADVLEDKITMANGVTGRPDKNDGPIRFSNGGELWPKPEEEQHGSTPNSDERSPAAGGGAKTEEHGSASNERMASLEKVERAEREANTYSDSSVSAECVISTAGLREEMKALEARLLAAEAQSKVLQDRSPSPQSEELVRFKEDCNHNMTDVALQTKRLENKLTETKVHEAALQDENAKLKAQLAEIQGNAKTTGLQVDNAAQAKAVESMKGTVENLVKNGTPREEAERIAAETFAPLIKSLMKKSSI